MASATARPKACLRKMPLTERAFWPRQPSPWPTPMMRRQRPATSPKVEPPLDLTKMLDSDGVTDPQSGLPIGSQVDASPARLPTRTVLRGRLVTIAPIDPAEHEQALYEGTHGRGRE